MLGLNTGLIAGFAVDACCCGQSKVKGSGIGGIAATQEVIDLCASKNIFPDIVVVPVWEINKVYEKLDASNESGERFVLDLANTLNEDAFDKCKNVPPPVFGPPEPPMSCCSILGGICGLLCSCRWC